METTIKVEPAELSEEFFKSLARIFKGKENLEITINIKDKPHAKYLYKESKKEYFDELNRAIEDMKNGKKPVSFTMQEFAAFAKKNSAK